MTSTPIKSFLGFVEREEQDEQEQQQEEDEQNSSLLSSSHNTKSSSLPPSPSQSSSSTTIITKSSSSIILLQQTWYRLQTLEKWRELGIRPSSLEDCHVDDRFLLPTSSLSKRRVDNNTNKDNDDHNNENEDNDDDGDDECIIDDIHALTNQCDKVRCFMNETIISTLSSEPTIWEEFLIPDTSQIIGAGLGLYYRPNTNNHDNSDDNNDPNNDNDNDRNDTDPVSQQQQQHKQRNDDSPNRNRTIPPNTIICYYTGHIHSFSSSRRRLLQLGRRGDRLSLSSSYLLAVRDDILVDPSTMLQIKARYINDPLHDKYVNCSFCDVDIINDNGGRCCEKKSKCNHHDPSTVPSFPASSSSSSSPLLPLPPRLAVVTQRTIQPGEELFVSYGQAYWNQHVGGPGTQFCPTGTDG